MDYCIGLYDHQAPIDHDALESLPLVTSIFPVVQSNYEPAGRAIAKGKTSNSGLFLGREDAQNPAEDHRVLTALDPNTYFLLPIHV